MSAVLPAGPCTWKLQRWSWELQQGRLLPQEAVPRTEAALRSRP